MKDLTQLLVSEFPAEAIPRSNSVYFKINDAPRVVEFLRKRRLVILGFEGIRMEGRALVPDLKLIADFSRGAGDERDWQARVESCADAAQRVLVQWPSEPHLVVEFVVKDPRT